jgi:hypothetical protein
VSMLSFFTVFFTIFTKNRATFFRAACSIMCSSALNNLNVPYLELNCSYFSAASFSFLSLLVFLDFKSTVRIALSPC